MTGFNRYEPPPPSTQGDEDLDENSLQEAERFYDVLPQPFRRINKILGEILELVWIQIEKQEDDQQYINRFQQEILNVAYEEELLLTDQVQVITIQENYVFAFGTTCVTVFVLPELRVCAKCAYYDMCGLTVNSDMDDSCTDTIIFQAEVIFQQENNILLATLNTRGEVFIFGFKIDTLYFITKLSVESGGEANEGEKIEKMSLADDGLHLALSSKGHPHGNNTLFIYKIPLNEWMDVLTTMKTASELEEENRTMDENLKEPGEELTQGTISSVSQKQLFVKAHVVFKVNRFQIKSSMNSVITSKDLMECGGESTMLIGDGSHHMLTDIFFENLRRDFERQYNCKGISEIKMDSLATCHFLKGGYRTSLFPQSSSNETNLPTGAVCVWWQDTNQLLVYSLNNDGDSTLLSVLPQAESIVMTAVSELTDLIAVALKNHCITVWNRYTGQPLKTFLSDGDEPINLLCFSRVCENGQHGLFGSKLTYATTGGGLWHMKCGSRGVCEPIRMDQRYKSSDVGDYIVKCFAAPLNMLAVVWDSGKVILYDETTGQSICQLDFVNTNKQSDVECEVQLAFSNDRLVALRDENIDGQKRLKLFLFDPNNHSTLKPFFVTATRSPASNTASIHEMKWSHGCEKHYQQFLERRHQTEEAMLKRVASYKREFLENDKYLVTAKT